MAIFKVQIAGNNLIWEIDLIFFELQNEIYGTCNMIKSFKNRLLIRAGCMPNWSCAFILIVGL